MEQKAYAVVYFFILQPLYYWLSVKLAGWVWNVFNYALHLGVIMGLFCIVYAVIMNTVFHIRGNGAFLIALTVWFVLVLLLSLPSIINSRLLSTYLVLLTGTSYLTFSAYCLLELVCRRYRERKQPR